MKDKFDSIKRLKTIFMANNNLSKSNAKRQIGLIWANHKGLIYLIYKVFQQINKKKINNTVNGLKILFRKTEKQMTFKHIRKCSILHIIREMRCHASPLD